VNRAVTRREHRAPRHQRRARR